MDAFEAISLPESSSVQVRKTFSVAEANRALTLVRRIVTDIVRQYARLRKLHETCGKLDATGNTAKAEELRQQYAAVTDELSALREELEEIGCELKDFGEGLVDFPALHGGRPVLLCWKLGEDRVAHWHEVADGYAGRRPIREGEWN